MDWNNLQLPTKAQVVTSGGALVAIGGIDLLAHGGPLGVILGLGAAYGLYKYGPRDWNFPSLTKRQAVGPAARPVASREDDELRRPAKKISGLFTFSQILKNGFVPTLDKIYLGQMEDGTPVYCAAKDLCHVALAGSTGNGKSSIKRMLMAQLCYAGANVLNLDPHFTRYDIEASIPEDWTPFEPYLMHDPMETRKYDVIGYYLKQVATELLPKRLDKYAHSKKLGKPYFIVLDELPAIVDEVPDAALYLSKILKQGRKVGIYLISSSQDFLVKSIDPSGKDGGAVRKCYRTAYYTGGDQTTANILLGAGQKIAENQLGKGIVILRNDPAVKEPQICKVPYMDNEALYTLLGPSTFEFEDEDESDVIYHPGEKQTDDLDPNASFLELFEAMTNSHSQEALRTATMPRVPSTPRLPDLPMREPVKELVAPCNAREPEVNVQGQIHDVHEDESKKFTPAEVAEVLKAYAVMVRVGQQPTRKGLIEYLNKNVGNHWNTGTKCYPKFQAICDEVGI